MNSAKGRIIEIFSSIQGEGLWVGKPQVFVRFHGCRLQCGYCDTPLTHSKITQARIEYPPYSKAFEKHPLEFGVEDLDRAVTRFGIPSVALTGGEPLEQADFIEAWLKNSQGKYEVLLETSGIETQALKQVLPYVDMVSMDIKIPSATGESGLWEQHQQFLAQSESKPHYAKVVYDEKITEEETMRLKEILTRSNNLLAIFQPVSPIQKRDLKRCLEVFEGFARAFPERVRLIPQVHKFLSVL